MHDIFGPDGSLIGMIPLSERQLELLADDGSTIAVQFHTPQLLRDKLPPQNGAFELTRNGEQIMSRDTDMVRRYVNLAKAISDIRNKD